LAQTRDGAWHRLVAQTRNGAWHRLVGGRRPGAVVAGIGTCPSCVETRSGYVRAAASAFAFFFAGDGLIRTTSHVIAAASEITHAMKTMMPMIPSTFATEVG
jgi:hypothetical protein